MTAAAADRDAVANILGACALHVVDLMDAAVIDDGGLGPTASAALVRIVAEPGRSIAVLARTLDISHPAAVQLVDRLEGLVVRRPVAGGRTKALHPTRSGVRRAAAIEAARIDALRGVVDSLDDRQRAALLAVSRSVLSRIEVPEDGDHACRRCAEDRCPDALCPVLRTG